jgi:hypothetical protein
LCGIGMSIRGCALVVAVEMRRAWGAMAAGGSEEDCFCSKISSVNIRTKEKPCEPAYRAQN